MSTATLELKQINDFDELDAFDLTNSIDNHDDDGTTQLIEAIATEQDYLECAYYDSAW